MSYVAHGYNDSDQPCIVHDTVMLQATSIFLILSTSCILNFHMFSHDVTQAYIQSRYKLCKKIYTKPKREDLVLFGLDEGQVLKLFKPFYGICEAGDYWNITTDEYIIKDLRMIRTPRDGALYANKDKRKIIIVTSSYYYDFLSRGKEKLIKLTDAT